MTYKTITVSIDFDTYWLACARATELEMTLPELASELLCSEALRGSEEEMEARRAGAERERMIARDRRVRQMNKVIEEIRARGGGLRMEHNLTREELYDRDRARREAREAAKVELRAMLRDLERQS